MFIYEVVRIFKHLLRIIWNILESAGDQRDAIEGACKRTIILKHNAKARRSEDLLPVGEVGCGRRDRQEEWRM